MTKKNKQTVLAYVDAFNRGDIDALCALFAPDALVHGVLGWGGVAQARPIWRAMANSFGMNLQVDAIIEEDDVVAVRYTEREKSFTPFRTEPAGDGTYEAVAIEWFEVKDGLIQRRWGTRDSASVFRQGGCLSTESRVAR